MKHTKDKLLASYFEKVTKELPAAMAPPKWKFDAQTAVDLLFGAKEEYPFQRAAELYLFLVWALIPGRQNSLRQIAASLALELSLTGVIADKKGRPTKLSTHAISADALVKRRFEREWYRQFYDGFIWPLNGFRSAIDAPSRGAMDTELRKAREEYMVISKIVDYVAKCVQLGPVGTPFLKRNILTKAFEVDVLNVGPELKASTKAANGSRRSSLPPKRPLMGIKKATIDKYLSAAPDTCILMYVLHPVLTDHTFNNGRLLRALVSDSDFLNGLKDALCRYETISSTWIKAWGPESSVGSLHPVAIKECAAASELPRFEHDQRRQIQQIFQAK